MTTADRRDARPVDLGVIIDTLERWIDEGGEVGIYGDYGPPAAPVMDVVNLLLENATAIERGTGDYADGE